MPAGRLVALIQSRAFGVAAFAVLVLLLATYLVDRMRTAGNPDRKLNISCFAYRDVNRNGTYDLGDAPYSGLEVTMLTPAGRKVVTTSNIAGFANFTMSRHGGSADIRSEGTGTITVQPPSGWSITSGNGGQSATFRYLAGTPAGIVMERTFQPVGIAPDLTISGAIKPGVSGEGAAGAELRVLSPRGVSRSITVAPEGRFSFPAEAGEWRLDYTSGGNTATRRVMVKQYPVVVATLEVARPDRSSPDASHRRVVAGFDTLGVSNQVTEVPNGYAGLQWYNWVAIHQRTLDSVGMVNATVSGEFIAYISSGHPATISSPQPFDFIGGHVGVIWPEGEKGDAVIRAWRKEQLIYEDRFAVRVAGPVFFAADYRDVTRIEFASATYWQLAIDDLQFQLPSSEHD